MNSLINFLLAFFSSDRQKTLNNVIVEAGMFDFMIRRAIDQERVFREARWQHYLLTGEMIDD